MALASRSDEGDGLGAGEPRSRRFGIRTKLFLAFLGFAGLTLAASAIAWVIFESIDRSVTRVTQESVPGMVDALDLAKAVTEVAATAPALVASSNNEKLAVEKARLEANLGRLAEVSAAVVRTGHIGANDRELDDISGALVAELGELSRRVEDRLALTRKREAAGISVQEAHARFIETLEPLVDDAVFDLVISGEQVMAGNTSSITRLVDDGVVGIDHLLSISAAMNLAAGLMGEAINVADPVALAPIRERFNSAALAIERSLGQLPKSQDIDTLRRASDSLLELGRGQENLFDLRAAALPGGSGAVSGGVDIAAQLKEKHEQFQLLITPIIDDAAFGLVMTTEEITEQGETAISGLIEGNAHILGLMQTAQAEGNLLASLLSDAAVAGNENLLQPLAGRFSAIEARLGSLLSEVEASMPDTRLAEATNALLELGRGEAGVFALRRAELAETTASEAALDASRALSLRLGDLVSGIVAQAETASRLASDDSASAIKTGHGVLLLITLLGLAGAAIVMFRYVDPRIIRPIGRVTSAMTKLAEGDTSVDIPGRDRKDELGDMARALGVFRDTAIAVQEANLREIHLTRQRLADAIESISEGFSLYDADDKLVVSNSRYQQMLYPDMPGMIVPGVTFRELLERAVAAGLIADAGDDPQEWIAERIARRRDPGPSHVQRRNNGRYIMVSERKTGDGGTVAVYSDITELKQREAELSQKSAEMEQLAGQLAKYLSPQVYESIFSGRQEVKLQSERKKLTVFFSDIVDFTATSESLQPEDLTLLLNQYLTEMAKIALQYGATIDKYVGDAIVIFFGDPETLGVEEDALKCVEMAIAMTEKMQDLRSHWHNKGIEKPVQIRIGINTGYCTVGNFGSESRMDYTIIGSGVNLAARLETSAQPGTILIAHETHALVRNRIRCEAQEPILVKGVAKPVATYRVVGKIGEVGQQGDFLREEHLNLHLEMNPAAMTQDERERAEATLRSALEHLSGSKPEGRTGKA